MIFRFSRYSLDPMEYLGQREQYIKFCVQHTTHHITHGHQANFIEKEFVEGNVEHILPVVLFLLEAKYCFSFVSYQ